jgi:hypothetical protein
MVKVPLNMYKKDQTFNINNYKSKHEMPLHPKKKVERNTPPSTVGTGGATTAGGGTTGVGVGTNTARGRNTTAGGGSTTAGGGATTTGGGAPRLLFSTKGLGQETLFS